MPAAGPAGAPLAVPHGVGEAVRGGGRGRRGWRCGVRLERMHPGSPAWRVERPVISRAGGGH